MNIDSYLQLGDVNQVGVGLGVRLFFYNALEDCLALSLEDGFDVFRVLAKPSEIVCH